MLQVVPHPVDRAMQHVPRTEASCHDTDVAAVWTTRRLDMPLDFPFFNACLKQVFGGPERLFKSGRQDVCEG